MAFSVDELLAWTSRHEGDHWATLRRERPFGFHVTDSGIAYLPESGTARNVPRKELESFCAEYLEPRLDSPGAFPHRWHTS